MIANYHTHTWRCNHATGREEEYVQTALERGFQILGFSDHTPYLFPVPSDFRIRMTPEQLKEYCDTVRLLQKKYADRIRIPLGVELEYYPGYFADTVGFLRDHGVEYALLGQHFLGNEIGEHYNGHRTGDGKFLERYCDQSITAMQTGVFSYFAHPDLMRFVGDDGLYRQQMRRICREAKGCGLPLEMNMLGSWSGRNYPDRRFWELAAEEGCPVVLGCDAHDPGHLNKPETEEGLLSMARELGLEVLESVELRKL